MRTKDETIPTDENHWFVSICESYMDSDIKIFYDIIRNLNTGHLILPRDYYCFLDVAVVLWVVINFLSLWAMWWNFNGGNVMRNLLLVVWGSSRGGGINEDCLWGDNHWSWAMGIWRFIIIFYLIFIFICNSP